MPTTFWLENLEERHYLENLGLDGKIILEWILGRKVEEYGLDSSGSG
jgi:hypothetical protein